MKIAILSDVHGNTIALDAVLADIEAQGGVDGYWIVGDLAALGHDPTGAVERMRGLPNVQFVRGNTDRSLVQAMDWWSDDTPTDQLKGLFNMTKIFAWTRGAITEAGQFGWFANLPLEMRVTLPDGTRVLCVHAAPGTDDGKGFHPSYDEAEMVERVADADADLVFVGHTHHPMNRLLGDVHLVNLGAVNIHPPNDLRSKYVILESDADGYTVEHRYLEVDTKAIADAIAAVHHPSADYLRNLALNGNEFFTKRGEAVPLPESNVKHPRPKA